MFDCLFVVCVCVLGVFEYLLVAPKPFRQVPLHADRLNGAVFFYLNWRAWIEFARYFSKPPQSDWSSRLKERAPTKWSMSNRYGAPKTAYEQSVGKSLFGGHTCIQDDKRLGWWAAIPKSPFSIFSLEIMPTQLPPYSPFDPLNVAIILNCDETAIRSSARSTRPVIPHLISLNFDGCLYCVWIKPR